MRESSSPEPRYVALARHWLVGMSGAEKVVDLPLGVRLPGQLGDASFMKGLAFLHTKP